MATRAIIPSACLFVSGINLTWIRLLHLTKKIGNNNHYWRSNPKALWSVVTASSVYLALTTQDILISEVLIIIMLMPSWARTLNILAATPEWLIIPTPMIETFATSSSISRPLAPISLTTVSTMLRASLISFRETVKVKSVYPSTLAF